MEATVLASGSSGNSIYIEEGQAKMLVDAGLSGKMIEEKLSAVGKQPGEIQGILVTHEHQDHIKGVGVLSRKYDIPVYATGETWLKLESSITPVCPGGQKELKKQGFYLGDIWVEPFPLSHDAVDPVGFCLHGKSKKLGIATDSGFFTPPMISKLKDCHGLILESNHDHDLLSKSSYPEFLKKRIRSRKGHISNNTLVDNLPKLVNNQLNGMILAHLSEENNCPDKVRATVSNVLSQLAEQVGTHISFDIADKYSPPVTMEL